MMTWKNKEQEEKKALLKEIEIKDKAKNEAKKNLLKKKLGNALKKYKRACEIIELALINPESYLNNNIKTWWKNTVITSSQNIRFVEFKTFKARFLTSSKPLNSFVVERLEATHGNSIREDQLNQFIKTTAGEINQIQYSLDFIEAEYEEIKEELTSGI